VEREVESGRSIELKEDGDADLSGRLVIQKPDENFCWSIKVWFFLRNPWLSYLSQLALRDLPLGDKILHTSLCIIFWYT
jgi:hypothetical protein